MDRNGRAMFTVTDQFRYRGSNVPASLYDLSLNCIVNNLETVCTDTPAGYVLRDGLNLPRKMCDAMVEAYQLCGGKVDDRFVHIFKDVNRTQLGSVHVRDSKLTDAGLRILLRHKLYRLELANCDNLTYKSYTIIFKHAVNLEWLKVGPVVQLTPDCKMWARNPNLDDIPVGPNGNTPNIKSLALHETVETNLLGSMLRNLVQLENLDLSHCSGIGSLSCLSKLTSLHTLVLNNVPDLNRNNAIIIVCSLRTLVVLDLSQNVHLHSGYYYEDENKTLEHIVKCLPNLKHLDISGTNLAGIGPSVPFNSVSLSGKTSDIPGLISRVDNPLEYLGLFYTEHDACLRSNIPAKIIGGHANEEQLFNAAAASENKPDMLYYIINELIANIFTPNRECEKVPQVIDLVLDILNKHVQDNDKLIDWIFMIQTIFSFMVIKKNELNNIDLKQRIVNVLITFMLNNKTNEPGLYAACEVLMCLQIPEDLLFAFKRCAQILLYILSDTNREHYDESTGTDLLYALACYANKNQRMELGDNGLIETMLVIIRRLLYEDVYNHVIELAFDAIRCITHEVPKNCKRFIDLDGMSLVLLSYNTFPLKLNLCKIIMSLMNNIAEVKELRSILMERRFVESLLCQVSSPCYDIKVNFYAAGVFAYLASDGHEAWSIQIQSRDSVLNWITNLIESWSLDTDIEENYCTVKPFLQLAQIKHTPLCVLWAVWALANCITAKPEKFCALVIAEGGLINIRKLIEEHSSTLDLNNQPGIIFKLAQVVVNQCEMYEQKNVEAKA